ncbi:monovalent cation/H+ antiporter complex subunit F [Egicoccus sp. AB-alg6-2]|uniref:monovalent cation/H+ antiporter complex subunit F n=1 Tax=Egicoccus sp. AB-alg6-2 TaxID=3242692 RepID=UPI00359E3663
MTTPWVVAAGVLLSLLAVGSITVLRGDTLARVVGLQLASVLSPIIAVVVAIATGRHVFLEVALALAVLSLAGSLVYARSLERWL